jgi:hypothetical protein
MRIEERNQFRSSILIKLYPLTIDSFHLIYVSRLLLETLCRSLIFITHRKHPTHSKFKKHFATFAALIFEILGTGRIHLFYNT